MPTPPQSPESPDGLSTVEARLGTRWLGHPLVIRDSLPSTMEAATLRAREGPGGHGTVILARAQTRGRGRRGRVWFSAPGLGLYLSCIIEGPLPARAIGALSPAAGLAVAEALAPWVQGAPKVKWPNDVRIRGKKLAGLLAQAEIDGDRATWVVLGVGVNLGHQTDDFPPELAASCTSLKLEGAQRILSDEVLLALLEKLEERLNTVMAEGFTKLVGCWNARCDHLDRQVRLRQGDMIREGRSLGIDDQGRLLLASPSGAVQALSIGELDGG